MSTASGPWSLVCGGSPRAPRLLLALLTVAAFANTIPNGFVWIDHWQVEGGGLVAHSWHELWQSLHMPLGSMPHWEGSAPYARPVVVAVLSLLSWLVGPHAAAYHLTLGLLHLGNVVLSYGLLRAFAVAPGTAFMAAAIFAVHPLQTAAISWISGIADPLFTFFVLVAWRCQIAASADRRASRWLRIAAVLSFVCALGAKETAVVFPLMLVAGYVSFPGTLEALRRHTKGRARAMGAAVAPFFVVLAVDALYRLAVVPGGALGGALDNIPLSVRLRTVPRLLMDYFTLPLRFGSLSICDDYALSLRWDVSTVAAAAALALLLASLARWWRRYRDIAFGVAWVFLGLVPVLNVVPILHYRADRFFYFPMMGWCLAVVSAIAHGAAVVGQRLGLRRLRSVATVGAALTLLTLAVLTVRRNTLFANDVMLFEATTRRSPLCREAHTALGDAYLRNGRNADAVTEYERARAASPGRASYVVMPKVLINLGMGELAVGNYAAAEDAFSEAHRLQPELLHPVFGLGVANLGLGRVDAAVTWLEQAYAMDATNPDVVFNLALGYDRLGRSREASLLYRRYLNSAPRGRARNLAQERLRILSASETGGPSPD